MKNTLIRIVCYIPFISFFWWVLTPGFFNPEPFQGSLIAQAAGHITFYGITYGFWIAAYELVYRAMRHAWKSKPVAETQRLEPQDTRPTAVLEVRK